MLRDDWENSNVVQHLGGKTKCCATIGCKPSQLARRTKKKHLFGMFFSRSPSCFLLLHNLYMERIFWKENGSSLCFWPQVSLIQSSAPPQGSPPPTRQINIRDTNQLSWAINYHDPHLPESHQSSLQKASSLTKVTSWPTSWSLDHCSSSQTLKISEFR